MRITLALIAGTAAMAAFAAPAFEEVYPAEPDPLIGNYVGRFGPAVEVNPEIAAQVYGLGYNNYRIRIVNKLFMRCPPLLEVDSAPRDGVLHFEGRGFKGQIDGKTATGVRGEDAFSMTKYSHTPPTLGAKPPAGAVVLFDGSGFDAWQEPVGWELLEGGVMMVTPDGKTLKSKGVWKDCKLHVEFRLPSMPGERGQGRGNSGVFVQDVYETQVLDSFGLEGYYDECGALYKLSAPHVNACLPPLEWQTFDIEYTAPRYSASGQLEAYGRITVYHNGVLIHNDQELTWITAWTEKERLAPPPQEAGRVLLQAHNNYVQFRNIWLVDTAKK